MIIIQGESDMVPVLIYDTTLRDGTQGEDINFSADAKIRIAKKLDDMGIRYVEGGWPGSNPKDIQYFDKAKVGNSQLSHCQK